MIRFARALLCLMLLLPVPAGSQNLDTRGVGYLDLGTAGGCTGTLIAPDLVLTAGHCLGSRRNIPDLTVEQVTFHPSTPTGQPGEGFAGRQLVVHPVYLIPGLTTERRVARDLALLQLQRPVSPDLATPIATGQNDPVGEKGFVISFRGKFSRARHRTCRPFATSKGLLQLGCEVKKGESGSPYLILQDGKLAVVAVISASSKRGRQPVALAADLSVGYAGLLEAFDSLK